MNIRKITTLALDVSETQLKALDLAAEVLDEAVEAIQESGEMATVIDTRFNFLMYELREQLSYLDKYTTTEVLTQY